MDSIEKLIGYYNKSPEDDIYHNVVELILRNLHKVEESTIYDLAEICYSSPSTISRLVKRLEFENYTDFKTKLGYGLKNYRYLNRNTRDIQVAEDEDVIDLYFNFLLNNINALRDRIDYDLIRAVSDHFHDAENVVFYSYPEVQIDILQKSLIIAGKKADVYNTVASCESSVEKIKEDTVVFAVIPDLIEMAPMRSVLKRVKELGATVITLCSEEQNDYEKYSDIQISFQGTKTSMDLYLFMILVNIIKYDYCRRYVDQMIEEMYG